MPPAALGRLASVSPPYPRHRAIRDWARNPVTARSREGRAESGPPRVEQQRSTVQRCRARRSATTSWRRRGALVDPKRLAQPLGVGSAGRTRIASLPAQSEALAARWSLRAGAALVGLRGCVGTGPVRHGAVEAAPGAGRESRTHRPRQCGSGDGPGGDRQQQGRVGQDGRPPSGSRPRWPRPATGC